MFILINIYKIFIILLFLIIISSCSYIFEPENEELIELSPQEKEFIRNMGHFNISNIRMGELATSKASSEMVRDFGGTMIDAYTTAQNELKNMTTFKNLDVPDTLDVLLQLNLNTLSAIDEHHFDSAYLNHQIVIFKDTERQIKSQINQLADKDLINKAESNLSLISTHQVQAEHIWNVIKSSHN